MSKSANNTYNTKNKTNYKLLFITIFAEICLQQAEGISDIVSENK